MLLTVLRIAFPFSPLIADASGGAKQPQSRVDSARADAGYRSTAVPCHGFPISSVEEMVAAVYLYMIDRLSAAQCWRAARERFGAETYFALYKLIAAGRHPVRPLEVLNA
jgi:hypothetical protein